MCLNRRFIRDVSAFHFRYSFRFHFQGSQQTLRRGEPLPQGCQAEEPVEAFALDEIGIMATLRRRETAIPEIE